MDEAEFWRLVARPAAENPDADPEDWADAVTEALADRPPADSVAFDRHLTAAMDRGYTWDLWGAAYLIRGGCGDDGFGYFRRWLIAQGRERFEAALADPDSLADVPGLTEDDGEGVECEGLRSAAFAAYERATGEELPADPARTGPPELGAGWDFDDDAGMRRRYPRLWALTDGGDGA